MAVILINTDDKFSDWRTKNNQLSTNVGDFSLVDLSNMGLPGGTTWDDLVDVINLLAQYAGGARGGNTDKIFYENDITVTTNYTISTNKNAGSFGPITIADGVTVTIPDGSVWSIT